MHHVTSFHFMENTDTDLMEGHGRCKDNLYPGLRSTLILTLVMLNKLI